MPDESKKRKSFVSKDSRVGSAEATNRSSFTFEDLRFYLFKQSIVYSSLLYSSTLRMSREDASFLATEHPVVKGFFDTIESGGDMESLLRADSLGNFITAQRSVASGYLAGKKTFSEIEVIPMPPYIPASFLKDLKIAVDEACSFSTDRKAEMILKGHRAFVLAISALKNKVYRTLFAFLKNTGEQQEEKRQKVCLSYINFLVMIDGDSELNYFCKWMSIDPLLNRIKERNFRTKPKNTSSTEKMLRGEQLDKFKSFLGSSGNSFFSISPPSSMKLLKKNTLFSPIMFSGLYSYMSTELFATSPSDVSLHLFPLLSNLNEKEKKPSAPLEDKEDWDTVTTVSDIQNLFGYKQKKALQRNNEILKSIRDLDKATLAFKEKVLVTTGEEEIAYNFGNIELSNTLIDLIEREVRTFSLELDASARSKFKTMSTKSHFLAQSEQEQFISILNMVRLAFYEHRQLIPKIGNEFYGKIRNAILKKVIIVTVRNLTSLYYQKKEEHSITSLEKGGKTFSDERKQETEKNTGENDEDNADNDFEYEEESVEDADTAQKEEFKSQKDELFGV